MQVRLSEREIRLAACQAVERRLDWMREGRRERFDTAGPDGLGRDFVGALGELATAKFLRRYPGGFAAAGAGDLVGVEVRSVVVPAAALQVYESDPTAAVYVLAVVAGDVWRRGVDLVGFFPGEAAKVPNLWDASNRAPAYLVPQCWLLPVDGLPAWLANHGGIWNVE